MIKYKTEGGGGGGGRGEILCEDMKINMLSLLGHELS